MLICSRSATGWELPHNIPYEARIELIRESVSRWSTPSHDCFYAILAILTEVLEEAASELFCQFPSLREHLRYVVSRPSFLFAISH